MGDWDVRVLGNSVPTDGILSALMNVRISGME